MHSYCHVSAIALKDKLGLTTEIMQLIYATLGQHGRNAHVKTILRYFSAKEKLRTKYFTVPGLPLRPKF